MFCGPSALRAVGRTAVHCSGVLGVRAGAVMGRIRPQGAHTAAAEPFSVFLFFVLFVLGVCVCVLLCVL